MLREAYLSAVREETRLRARVHAGLAVPPGSVLRAARVVEAARRDWRDCTPRAAGLELAAEECGVAGRPA